VALRSWQRSQRSRALRNRVEWESPGCKVSSGCRRNARPQERRLCPTDTHSLRQLRSRDIARRGVASSPQTRRSPRRSSVARRRRSAQAHPLDSFEARDPCNRLVRPGRNARTPSCSRVRLGPCVPIELPCRRCIGPSVGRYRLPTDSRFRGIQLERCAVSPWLARSRNPRRSQRLRVPRKSTARQFAR